MANVWRILVAPKSTWIALGGGGSLLDVMYVQWLLLLLASVLVQRPLYEVFTTAQIGGTAETISIGQLLWLSVALIVMVVLIDLAGAGLLKLAALPLGEHPSFRACLVCFSFSLMPVMLGTLIAALLFALIQPLSNDPSQAIALALRPYSFGLATFLPQYFPPVTLSWFLASYLDVFSLWGLWLIITGARWYLGISSRKTAWLAFELMILSVAVIIGLWQYMQRMVLLVAR